MELALAWLGGLFASDAFYAAGVGVGLAGMAAVAAFRLRLDLCCEAV